MKTRLTQRLRTVIRRWLGIENPTPLQWWCIPPKRTVSIDDPSGSVRKIHVFNPSDSPRYLVLYSKTIPPFGRDA